ncbi:hypothetical protein COOONC_08951 [Cooperia oncophora]
MESRTMEQRSRHASGTGSSYITRAAGDRQGTDTYSKRYNYRSRSDIRRQWRVGQWSSVRAMLLALARHTSLVQQVTVKEPTHTANATIIVVVRMSVVHDVTQVRRCWTVLDLVQVLRMLVGMPLSTLQRELDTLSRSPDRSTPRGYTSDTGNAYDTVRSKARGYSNYDYDTFSSSRHHETRSSAVSGGGGGATGITVPGSRYPGKEPADDAGRWADDLLEIVSEPMNKTLDRMKKYSSSSANVGECKLFQSPV